MIDTHARIYVAGHRGMVGSAIGRALEAELWFYGQVFGFTPADAIEPVEGAGGF